jgi:hypothetical protein
MRAVRFAAAKVAGQVARLAGLALVVVGAGLLFPAATGLAKTKRPVADGPPPAAPAPDVVDISAVKDKLKLFTDGKKHVVALVPFDDGGWAHVYYGDGQTFHALRVFGSSASGTESFDFVFWEPRVKARYQASFEFRAGKYDVLCDTRKTELERLPDAEGAALIAAATFTKPLWRYHAFALARDDRGTYYYVDRQREPEDSLNFRLFSGPRGGLAPLKMVNVVSDSEGQIFSTKAGDLRLVLDRHEAAWVKGPSRTKLVALPVEDNAALIYGDLGAYTGQRLGTPCDDL